MKKTLIITFGTAALSFSATTFATTETVKVETVKVENVTTVKEVEGGANAPVVVQPENKHAGAANAPLNGATNTPVEQRPNQKPTVVKVQPTVVKVERVRESNDSLYENIRSGWNRFIDLLVGPKQ